MALAIKESTTIRFVSTQKRTRRARAIFEHRCCGHSGVCQFNRRKLQTSPQITNPLNTPSATSGDDTARLAFNMGKSDVDVYLDNVGVFEGNNCGSFAAAVLPGTPPIALAASGLIGN